MKRRAWAALRGRRTASAAARLRGRPGRREDGWRAGASHDVPVARPVVHPLRRTPQQAYHLAGHRMPPQLRFLEHRRPVTLHLEPPTRRRDQLDLRVWEPLTNLGRQPDGPGLVVSHRAVFDRHAHRDAPRDRGDRRRVRRRGKHARATAPWPCHPTASQATDDTVDDGDGAAGYKRPRGGVAIAPDGDGAPGARRRRAGRGVTGSAARRTPRRSVRWCCPGGRPQRAGSRAPPGAGRRASAAR